MPRRQKKQTKKQKEKQNKLNEKAKKHLEKRWNKKNEIKEEDQQNRKKFKVIFLRKIIMIRIRINSKSHFKVRIIFKIFIF